MTCLSKLISALIADRRGATAIEYGLIAALIAVAAITGMNNFGTGLSSMWNNVATEVRRY